MTGVGIILAFFGYAAVYWGVNAIQGNSQPQFITQVIPFAKPATS